MKDSVVLPRLETERLILRPHRAEDLDAYRETWADPAVLKHFSTPPKPEEAWARMMRVAGSWALHGYGYFACIDKATGRYAGETGFADFRRALDPPQGNDPEAGWVFAGWTHGKGYAGEATRAVHDWMDAALAPKRLWCIIVPGNTPSIRLGARLGYVQTGETILGGETLNLYQRIAR
jgi:RimJ/RimL family protein N-acetyltransferase